MYENIPANTPIVLKREDFLILDENQWNILTRLIQGDIMSANHDPNATLYIYNKIMRVFKVMEKYGVNLEQIKEICSAKEIYDEISDTFEDALEPYTIDDVKPVADYVRLGEIQTGGRRKTRKNRKH